MMEKHRNQSAPSLLPTYKAFQQKIFKEKIPPEFKVTLDGLPFCIVDHIIPGRSGHVLGFSSPSGIATFLSGDRTFEILASTKFAQCWIIMNKVEKSAIPVAFFLLPSKEKICHHVMFEAFHETSVDIINPEYWLLDYEIGTINTLKEVFGNQTVVQGCLVHWKEEGARVGLGGGYQPQPGSGQVGQELVCNEARPCGGD